MGVRRPARLELLIDGGFALTFVLTRVVGCVTESPAVASQPDTLSTPPHHAASYGLGFTHSLRGLWLGYYAPLPAWAYRAMFTLVGCGFALNLAWFSRIVAAMQRKAVRAAPPAGSKAE